MKALAIIALLASAGGASALTLAECDRTTHISHAGETAHVDYGAGRIGYAEWWSQEGVYRDLYVVDCETGAFLRTRTEEDRISDRLAFDRTSKVVGLIEVEMTSAHELFSFERLAERLDTVGRDIEIATLTTEPCGCAALYPELRGEKTAFELMP